MVFKLSGAMVYILFLSHSNAVLVLIVALYYWLSSEVLLSNLVDKNGK